jgi:hypothetical protein
MELRLFTNGRMDRNVLLYERLELPGVGERPPQSVHDEVRPVAHRLRRRRRAGIGLTHASNNKIVMAELRPADLMIK